METTNTFNPHALPYKLEASHPTYNVEPLPLMHTFMCDLVRKIPSLHFVATGRASKGGVSYSDSFEVFSNTEKVGSFWYGLEYRNGAAIELINIRSPRIHQGRNGRQQTKKTKHYKVALREAASAFAPPKMKEVCEAILNIVDDRVSNIANRAFSQLTYAAQSSLPHCAEYIANVIDHGPQPLPELLVKRFDDGGWRQKLTNNKVAESVSAEMKRMDGVAIKVTKDGNYIAVDMRTKEVIEDLPENYQTKFAILRMMEKDQPIANTGVKFEFNDATYFYVTASDMVITGT